MTKIIRARNVKTGPGFGFLVFNPRSWILGAGSWVLGFYLDFGFLSQIPGPESQDYFFGSQVSFQSVGITKCYKNILSVTGITKCDSYYKVRQKI